MKFIAEVEEITSKLRKVVIKASSKEEAEKIIYNIIENSETIEELHSNLKSNSSITEIKDYDYENEEIEVSYIGEFEEEVCE